MKNQGKQTLCCKRGEGTPAICTVSHTHTSQLFQEAARSKLILMFGLKQVPGIQH